MSFVIPIILEIHLQIKCIQEQKLVNTPQKNTCKNLLLRIKLQIYLNTFEIVSFIFTHEKISGFVKKFK